MAIFALADLHLSFGTDKPMDVFGAKWENYTEKIYENWQSIVSNDDLVLIPGDVSWATYISDAYKDFKFINELKGRKVIIKGNHDYWWTTLKKMEEFLADNSFDTIRILNNNAVAFEDAAICGTRGWSVQDNNDEDDERIIDREKKRLILTLEEAIKLKKKRLIVGIHYPPFDRHGEENGFLEIMRSYGVDTCVYGHLHSYAHKNAVEGNLGGVELRLVSGDFVDFRPVKI
ncbi:MAG: serine/threonine protein phosphatase [Ruminococcaceae bacterium]|nr:serine/threonine protein phosphatase [Oscillospiraceae bacterium]